MDQVDIDRAQQIGSQDSSPESDILQPEPFQPANGMRDEPTRGDYNPSDSTSRRLLNESFDEAVANEHAKTNDHTSFPFDDPYKQIENSSEDSTYHAEASLAEVKSRFRDLFHRLEPYVDPELRDQFLNAQPGSIDYLGSVEDLFHSRRSEADALIRQLEWLEQQIEKFPNDLEIKQLAGGFPITRLRISARMAGVRSRIPEGRYVVFIHGTQPDIAREHVNAQGEDLPTKDFFLTNQFEVTKRRGKAVVGVAIPEELYERLVKHRGIKNQAYPLLSNNDVNIDWRETIVHPWAFEDLKGKWFFFHLDQPLPAGRLPSVSKLVLTDPQRRFVDEARKLRENNLQELGFVNSQGQVRSPAVEQLLRSCLDALDESTGENRVSESDRTELQKLIADYKSGKPAVIDAVHRYLGLVSETATAPSTATTVADAQQRPGEGRTISGERNPTSIREMERLLAVPENRARHVAELLEKGPIRETLVESGMGKEPAARLEKELLSDNGEVRDRALREIAKHYRAHGGIRGFARNARGRLGAVALVTAAILPFLSSSNDLEESYKPATWRGGR